MEVRITQHGDEATVALTGRVDANAAPDLKSEIDTIDPTVKTIVFDMAAMNYIASAGLRVLLATQKVQNAKQGMVILAHPQEAVVDILSATGFDSIFIIQP